LRDYGTGEWKGGDKNCDHQIVNKIGAYQGDWDRPSRKEFSKIGKLLKCVVCKKEFRGKKGQKFCSTKCLNTLSNKDRTESEAESFKICSKCGAEYIDRQIGLEKTPELYVEKMKAIFQEIFRIMKKTGTFWLNVGDTYGGVGHSDWKVSEEYLKTHKPTGNIRIPDFHHIRGRPKCLLMMPERLAFACLSVGFILRNKIIWFKPNSMPSSVKDRFSNSWEYLYFFSKAKRYWFDLDAVRLPHKNRPERVEKIVERKQFNIGQQFNRPNRLIGNNPLGKNPGDVININAKQVPRPTILQGQRWERHKNIWEERFHPLGRNPGDVIKWDRIMEERAVGGAQREALRVWREWLKNNPNGTYEEFYKWASSRKDLSKYAGTSKHSGRVESHFANFSDYLCLPNPKGVPPQDFWRIPTQPFPEAHFAVFPEKLCERPIKAGCPKQICKKCGKPRERISKESKNIYAETKGSPHGFDATKVLSKENRKEAMRKGIAFKKRWTVNRKTIGWTSCSCKAGFKSGIVLDPFCGSGTALVVAKKLGRNFIGIDIKPEYCEMARKRLEKVPKRIDKFVNTSKTSQKT